MISPSVKFGKARGVMEKVISDPNFSLIQLPIEFKARKHAGRASFKKPGSYELFNADGPGCIRHMTVIYKPFGDHARIEFSAMIMTSHRWT